MFSYNPDGTFPEHLHDGPDGNLPEEYFGAIGCLEVYGTKEFERLKETVRAMSGIFSEEDIEELLKSYCSKKLLTIHVEAAVSPKVVPNNL